jgi:signal transduction histidine kinase
MSADINSGSQAVRNLRWASGLLAALVLAFGLAFSWTSWQAEKARELQYLLSLAELGEKSLDAYFASIERALGIASQDMLDSKGEFDVERGDILLQRLMKAYPEMRIAIVSRPDGQILTTTEGTPRSALPSLANEPSFQRARDAIMNGPPFHIGRPFLGPVSKEWIIPLRYGVRNAGGNLAFLIGAGLPLSKPQSFWKDVPLPRNAAMALVGDDGYLRSRYPVPDSVDVARIYSEARSGPLSQLVTQQNPPRSGSFEFKSAISGEDIRMVFRRLSSYPVTFYVVTPRSNLLAAWWRSVQFSYALMLVIVLGALAVYRWALKRQIAWEREREQRIMDLQAANEELLSFSYSVSHDLRAPLRSITGFSNILHADSARQLDADGKANLERIIAAAARMTRLIDDLLSLSRVSRRELSLSSFNLGEIAREISGQLAQTQPERRVNFSIKPDMPVRADHGLMHIVMENLIGNAWKFTGKMEQAQIEIGSTASAGVTTYHVRDNGAGFDMAYAEKLFSPFQRMHHSRDFEGTGIGLATVRRVIQRHHGKVWIDSAVGRGTTVYFTIG